MTAVAVQEKGYAICNNEACINQPCPVCQAQFDAVAAANDAIYHSLRLGREAEVASPALANRDRDHLDHYNINGMASSMGSSTTPSTDSSNPGKGSLKNLSQVLQPRGILVNGTIDHQTVFEQIKLPTHSKLKLQLGKAHVDFDTDMLVKSCNYAIKVDSHEAAWTTDVYREYYLKTNNPAKECGGVLRDILPSYTFGSRTPGANNVCLPPPVSVGRHDSLRGSSEVAWLPIGKETFCTPDHIYYIGEDFPSVYRNLPAFRGGKHSEGKYGDLVSGPPYLVTEEKRKPKLQNEAVQYLSFVLGARCHEYLLLCHLTDEAQATMTIPFDDFKIFGMTNCGAQVKIFQMRIRPFKEDTSHTDRPRYVRYELVEIADLNIARKSGCNNLKTWMNYIHHWGLTTHMSIMKKKAEEVIAGQHHKTNAWQGSLHRAAFSYDTTGQTLKFEYLPEDNGTSSFDLPPIQGINNETTSHMSADPENPKPRAKSDLEPETTTNIVKSAKSTIPESNSTIPNTNSGRPSRQVRAPDSVKGYKPPGAKRSPAPNLSRRPPLAETSQDPIRSPPASLIQKSIKSRAYALPPKSSVVEDLTSSVPQPRVSASTSRRSISGPAPKNPASSSRVLRPRPKE